MGLIHYLNQCWNIVDWAHRNQILIEIHTFSFKNMHLKMFAKWRPFFFGLNVLICRLLSWQHPWAHNDDWYTKIQLNHDSTVWQPRQLSAFVKPLSNSSASSSIVLNKASGWAKMKSNFPTFTSSTECCKPLAVLTRQSRERLQAGTSCWARLLSCSDWIKLRGHITNTHPVSRSLLFLRTWGSKEYTRLFP